MCLKYEWGSKVIYIKRCHQNPNVCCASLQRKSSSPVAAAEAFCGGDTFRSSNKPTIPIMAQSISQAKRALAFALNRFLPFLFLACHHHVFLMLNIFFPPRSLIFFFLYLKIWEYYWYLLFIIMLCAMVQARVRSGVWCFFFYVGGERGYERNREGCGKEWFGPIGGLIGLGPRPSDGILQAH